MMKHQRRAQSEINLLKIESFYSIGLPLKGSRKISGHSENLYSVIRAFESNEHQLLVVIGIFCFTFTACNFPF